MSQLITGIQKVSIGVENASDAWKWYRHFFKMDIPVFDDEAEGGLMNSFTGNEVHMRRTVHALSLMGGGGFEVCQFTSRKPSPCLFKIQPGDLGINAIKLKSPNPAIAYRSLSDSIFQISNLYDDPERGRWFWVNDPYGNRFQVVEGKSWFGLPTNTTGGVCGAIIGVSDIDSALPLYTEVLGFDSVVTDQTGIFPGLDEKYSFRCVLLKKPQKNEGAFSRLYGDIELELLQVAGREPKKIFENRYWGDLGFNHLSFDVNNMDALKAICEKYSYKFKADSQRSFDNTSVRYSYIEDPDGTLIEFVQTHNVPIIKKLGWYLNLQKRKHSKPLPDWLLKSMSFSRVT